MIKLHENQPSSPGGDTITNKFYGRKLDGRQTTPTICALRVGPGELKTEACKSDTMSKPKYKANEHTKICK